MELKVFVVVDSVCFAFARPVSVVRPTWLRRDSECGRLCDHIFEVLEIESVLQIVRLNDIIDKFVVF